MKDRSYGREWGAVGMLVLCGLVGTMAVHGGNLDSPAVPTDPGSAMYTLEDLYNRLDAGTGGMQSVFTEPSAGPGSTGHSLNQVMGKAPATNANAAVAGDVLSGKTYWGLNAGAWGSNTGTRAHAPVPKTGQTTVYRTGDDATYQKGVASPSPRFTDNGDGTVTDNLTGLMWTKNANIWGTVVWNTAVDNCEGYSLAGYSDWRLPNLRELQSLIDYDRYNPALPSGYPFTGVQLAYYWSATTPAGSTTGAWYVGLYDGNVYGNVKTYTTYVWPVRGGQ